jgi:hypothetical protein
MCHTVDFREPRDLAEYLLHLQNDSSAYGAYFAWKERPFRPSFLALLAGQETPSRVRLCQAVQRLRRGPRCST